MEGVKLLTFLRNREKGVTTVEYAVMLVLVAIAVLAAAPNIKTSVLAVFKDIADRLTAAL